KQGVENCFGGASCSISYVNSEEFTRSTSLCRASLKSPPIFKSRSQSFKSFSTSSTHMISSIVLPVRRVGGLSLRGNLYSLSSRVGSLGPSM
ncbi:unnamed protein product, partial [Prunus brigantina]